jgi:hypothetical protein
MFRLTYKNPSTDSKIQGENFTCFTAYLVFVLFALRCQTVYHKNTYMIYDEPKIIGRKINLCNSYQLKVEDICSYNRNNVMSYKLLKLLEL